MRRAFILAAATVLCTVGSAFGTDYYWAGTGTNDSATSYWTTAGNWRYADNTVATDYPRLATDRALFTWCTAARYARLSNSLTLVVGEIDFGGFGAVSWRSVTNTTLTVTDDCGLSGNVLNHNSGTTYAANDAMYVEGNFSYRGGGSGVPLYMLGQDKYLRTTPDSNRSFGVDLYIDGGKIYDNHTADPNHIRQFRDVYIRNGGQWAAGAAYGASDRWLDCRNITIEPSGGSITGSVRLVDQGADNGNFRPSNIQGGVTYGRDLLLYTSYSGSLPSSDSWFERTIRGGDIVVGRDLNFSQVGSYQARSYRLTLNTLDNGISCNVTVHRRLNVGQVNDAKFGYLIKCNNSIIDIDDCVSISGTGYRTNTNSGYGTGALDMGSATIYVGGDWQNNRRFDTTTKTYDATRFIETAWNPGTSTVIFDGNGTVRTQTFYPDNLPFYNVFINTPGTVRLNTGTGVRDQQDQLLLLGSLEIQAGTFYQANKPITFNGDCHTLKVYAGAIVQGTVVNVKTDGVFDNIVLAPYAVLLLGSDITISSTDNLVMRLGSKLYLNGFDLTAYGVTWDSDLVSAGGVPFTTWGSDGTIYGTFAIPEPATLLLLGTGALGGVGWIRRRRMR